MTEKKDETIRKELKRFRGGLERIQNGLRTGKNKGELGKGGKGLEDDWERVEEGVCVDDCDLRDSVGNVM